MSIGAEIKRLRTEAGLTQTELASLVGIAQPSLVRIEGGGGVSVETLYSLCDVFKLDCNHFRKFIAPAVALPAPEQARGKRK